MQSKYVKTIINLLIYIIGILLICFLLPKVLRFFMPFVIGWIISVLANPLVKIFEKRLKIVRKHGTWLVIVGALALVIGAGYFMISWLVREGVGFVQNLPKMYSAMVQGIRDIGNNTSLLFQKYNLPVNVNEGLAEVLQNLDTYVGDFISALGAPTLSVAGGLVRHLPNLFVQAIFMFLSAYFFIADKEKISMALRKILPQSVFDRCAWGKRLLSRAVGGYFLAQFKIMGIVAAILFVGLLFLKVEYAILLALLIAFLDFIPFLGTGTILWPWAAFQLMTGDYSMAIGLMIICLVCLLAHQLLQPKFVGDTVGLDPLTTLLFMFIGYRLSGLLGMVIAVPIGILVVNLYKAGAFNGILEDIKCLTENFRTYRNN